jgi:hypothetical protein
MFNQMKKLIGMPVIVDLFQFTNGINGSGLLECIYYK